MGLVVLLVVIWTEVRAMPQLAKSVFRVTFARVLVAAVHSADSRQILMY